MGTPREVATMITLDDCLALGGLTNDEVRALAEHEHIPTSPPLRSANVCSISQEAAKSYVI